MMDLTIEGWPERMREKGHHVMTAEKYGLYTCILFNYEERLYILGSSSESMLDAIKKCQDRFGLRMLLKEMAAMDDKEVQDANVKEVKRLLGE